jgi:RNA polymerase sigma-70 factor, ECF subfamily
MHSALRRAIRDERIVPSPDAAIVRIAGLANREEGCKMFRTPALPRGKLLQFQAFDESYVERLRSGDFRTQEHFVAYFSELIQLKLRTRLHSPQAMEDVRQETFARVLSALRTPGGIRQPERLGPFVNSICNNVLMEHYRANPHGPSIDDDPETEYADPVIDVLGAVAARQMEQKVRDILEEMSERDRRILRAIFLEELDKDEVCREFGVDRDYLRVLLHRAKQSFKSIYLKNIERRPPVGKQ